jgi:hypothetical protein
MRPTPPSGNHHGGSGNTSPEPPHRPARSRDGSHPVPPWCAVPADRRARLSVGFALLREACDDARATGCDPWQFAVTVGELVGAGLRVTDLRWLVAVGVLDHAVELRTRSRSRRAFRRLPSTAVADASCFVLSDAGVRFCSELPLASGARAECPGDPPPRPNWDRRRRELTLSGWLVKRFRTPAGCQELILSAFQEEGWPPRIDDPLGRGAGRDGRHRLHDVVRALNRHQQAARVRFGRDGTGLGVCWEAAGLPRSPRASPPLPSSSPGPGDLLRPGISNFLSDD